MRKIIAITTLTAAAALTGPPATAAPPQRDAFEIVESGSVECSQYDPTWHFRDDYTDHYWIRRSLTTDRDGNLVKVVDHIVQVSDDVNSATGLTLHEHNHSIAIYDLVARTATYNGAENVMQRPGTGSVIRWTGHKVFSFDSDVPLVNSGPAIAGDEDFCRAIAP